MNVWKRLGWPTSFPMIDQWAVRGASAWANFNITTKFNVAFGGLFALLLLVSGTSYLFLSIVYRQAEFAIFTSTEIQRRIIEMDAKLQMARVHERDFFLRYPTVGLTEAQQRYASKTVSHIAEVIKLSKELEHLIQSSSVSDTLQKQNIDLNLYFIFAERYQDTFLEAIEIATQLAGDDDGVWGQLEGVAEQLEQKFSSLSDRELLSLYNKMRTLEKDYRVTNELTALQSTLNVVFDLHQAIDRQAGLSEPTRDEFKVLFSEYKMSLERIKVLERSLQQHFRDFDLQANKVDPVSSELIRLSKEEVERTQSHITQTRRWANTSLGTTIIVGLVLATVIARILNISITKRVIALNQTVESLESGNLDVRTKIANWGTKPDELGRLGQSFNKMAYQLQTTIEALETTNDQLEHRVQERTAELSATLRKLQSTQTQLVQTEKMSSLGQMVAGVAHEINNPISFIHGNIAPAHEYLEELTELLHLYQHHYPDPHPMIQDYIEEIDLDFVQQDLGQLLNSMQEGSTRIREIVKSLRVFSRIDESDFKDADVHAGLDSTLMILRNRLKHANKNCGIEVTKYYGNVPLVNCYPGQLNQVFMNIISNAIDALEAYCAQQDSGSRHNEKELSSWGAQIQIQTQIVESDWVLIKIIDNGPGLKDDVKEKLFDPFFTTKPVGKGTGLGLSVSYQIIVERHGGQLWCDSGLGQGTTFNIQIPIVQSNAPHV